MFKTMKSHTPTIPQLVDVNPKVAEAEALLNRLLADHAAALEEIQGLEVASAQEPSPVDYEQAVGVARLLGDPVKTAPPSARERLAAARRRAAQLDAACKEQDRRASAERQIASSRICDAIKGDVTALVKSMANGLAIAHQARLDYERVLNELASRDVSWAPMGSMRPMFLGPPADSGSNLGRWFKDAVEAGHLTTADVPAGLWC